jgi:hypothetical protein
MADSWKRRCEVNGILRQAQDGVYWRGRHWRVAGGDGSSDGSGQEGSESSSGPPEADRDSPSEPRLAEPEAARAADSEAGAHGSPDLVGELAAARERIAALESDLAAGAGQLAVATEAAGLAGQQALDAYRAQLIAENRDGIVEELVVGGTREALETSVEVARAAFNRVAEAARQSALGERVPAGAGERGTSDLDGLSPLEKIARGLTK